MNRSLQKTDTIRIAKAVKNQHPHLSQKVIKELIDQKKINIKGKIAKRNDWVSTNEEITIPNSYLAKSLAPNSNVNCQLIKKTKDYIFFDKGASVHSVAQSFVETDTAANWLLSVDDQLDQVADPLESGLLHRLDYETAGIMVAARNKNAFDYLKEQFQKNKVEKIYHCVVSRYPPRKGKYKARVKLKQGGAQKVKLQFIPREELGFPKLEKQAIEIETEILGRKKLTQEEYLLTIKLITGFRHQIRAHLALLDCPIKGDSLYGGREASQLMLRASKISFKETSGKMIQVKTKIEL